ncbi:hypothetical protein OAL55_05035 [Verrucomicrobiales bacterium]|nr:hypothetical protein [Verrucomicrobiales bacterium]
MEISYGFFLDGGFSESVTERNDGKHGIESFSPEDDELRIDCQVVIQNPSLLYEQVAEGDSQIGLALSWTSRDSGKRGVSASTALTNESAVCISRLSLKFERGSLLGEVQFEVVCYLLKSSNSERPGYCRTPGSFLGAFGSPCILCVDGDGAVFPVTEISSNDQPLWILRMDWENVADDPFSKEHFELTINKAHPEYPSFNPQELGSIPPALKEILTTCLFAFIQKIREDESSWEAVTSHVCPPGTIGDAAWHFLNSKNWETADSGALLLDIRSTFEE